MRITNNMLVNNMMNNIGKNLVRMDRFQNQMSTGKKISVPSDDPVVAARALKLRTDVAEVDQYQRNVKDAQSWLDITENALGNVGDIFHRIRELAVQAGNDTNTPDDTEKIKQEVTQLKTQLVHIANTTYAGRYVFSGYATDKKLMNDDGSFAIGFLNDEAIKFEIGIGDDIHINVPGGELFNDGGGAGASQTGVLMEHVNNFLSALGTTNTDGIKQMISDVDHDMNNVLRIRADIGARQNRLELTSNRLDSDNINFTKLMSDNEDVDMAETIMNLKNEENVYRASLAGGARIIQPSLVDFLR